MTRKVEYMSTHWPACHPVRRQFYEGHPDWEKEFDAYHDLQKKTRILVTF
jgi:hypothetical protein